MTRLRLVAFTSGEMAAIDREFYRRLANDPLLDFAGIVVDDYQPRRKPLLTRIVNAVQEDGWQWPIFKVGSKLRGIVERFTDRFNARIHGPAREAEPPATPIHRVADIHSNESIDLIRALRPDLGIIVGTRILRQSVIAIPPRGTLNIHKQKLPDYRGGGPVGYWEIVAGNVEIGVSIHFATREVNSGAVIAQTTIPIDKDDTLESLKLKADLRGAQLYHEAILSVASGTVQPVVQDLSRGRMYRAPSEYKVWKLQRSLRKSQPQSSWMVRLRVFLQFLAVLPRLQRLRHAFLQQRRAPVAIFVADRNLNDLGVPFVTFVQQIEFLRRFYAVLPLGEVVARLQSGENNQIAASITFDDGDRDNTWAIEYLHYLRIPATFFVSIDHVFRVAAKGFTVGARHEDFRGLASDGDARLPGGSRDQVEALYPERPGHFAFPKGKRGTNITRAAFDLALAHFDAIFSAYGGYSFPVRARRHFLRSCHPTSVFDLSLAMAGYNGFRECLGGNGWGLRTEKLDPCTTDEHLRIALIAASARIAGGHSAQARTLTNALEADGHTVNWIAVDPRFPIGLRWIRRVPYVRTVLNELFYAVSLIRMATADVVHVFSASYWSFLLGPAPAIAAAKLLRKRVILHYHSGEADDHLRNWRKSVRPFLRLVDEIVVPSAFLQQIFESHGYRARVIPNIVDTSEFRFKNRTTLRPRLLSVRNHEAYYRVDNTILAFAELKKRFSDATLTVVGCGSQERRLRQLVESMRLDGVRFLGRAEPPQLQGIYEEADIFVNSSTVDNQPVSILEAFAAGLPVVSTPVGDIAAMLRHGEAGLLVPAENPPAMAEAIQCLLGRPDLTRTVIARARQELERYTWRRVRNEWMDVYRSTARSSAVEEAMAHGA